MKCDASASYPRTRSRGFFYALRTRRGLCSAHSAERPRKRFWNECFDTMDSHLEAAESVFVMLKKRVTKLTAKDLLKYCRSNGKVVIAPLNPTDDKNLTPPTVVFEIGDIEDNEDHVDRYPKDFPVDFNTRSTS